MSYQEWKHENKNDFEKVRRNFVIAANEYELDEALEFFFNLIKEKDASLIDDGK